MELDSATMAVSLIGFELGSGHREQYCTVEELYYEAEIRNVARQQALIFMYLPLKRDTVPRLRGPCCVTANSFTMTRQLSDTIISQLKNDLIDGETDLVLPTSYAS